ncbi:hypothetical protein Cri9333_4055 [Crinalium epipsammum PCC 9333]|uniref:Uncharacterized protein n=1 Tax=Crinalium epipsammum PCC 9333 TaxID=1173022 RepID=K9W5V7_9CYAN|nr:hypothetical protein [Crinalium epipsammum]AFZ14860.1 hypothetical protein Cri9333_4055 [Crinalium epipsammum PCC 9333]
MSALNQSTRRRLSNLHQTPSVWEGDRRPISGLTDDDFEDNRGGECIVWVDGVEGVVRGMEVVPSEMGPEAIVRTLLKAMEHPQSPATPARPQKIVVRDREIQFYLRGVLQDLDIAVEYAPELPLIDELFRGFQQMASGRPPKIPPKYADLLMEKSYQIWEAAPWEVLADHQIISITLNQWDIETLYVAVMGMMGMEYGLLFYRSLDSLKRFRAAAIAEESFEQMEEAFLGQDCLFITFESLSEDEDADDEEIDYADLPVSEIQPNFGTINPFEGMRPFLYEEEAIALYVAIEALQKFVQGSARQLSAETLPKINKRLRITLPEETGSQETISIQVSTLPEFEAELLQMMESAEFDDEDYDDDDDDDDEDLSVPLREDVVPKDALKSLDIIPWEKMASLRKSVDYYQHQDVKEAGEGMPVVLIQTTLPKGKALIEQIKADGGLKGICFNPGEDPFADENYDLGILQAENGNMYLFGEFSQDDALHLVAKKKWDQRCKKTQGYCGLIIAKGLTGAARGNPQPKDMIALFETRSLSVKELGLGLLQLMSHFDFE